MGNMMITNRTDINNLLSQMQAMKTQAGGNLELRARSDVEASFGVDGSNKVGTSTAPDFTSMFNNAINTVNETQQASGALSTAYQQGDPSVSLTQVMVASEKSSVSFQALSQVRNKLVEAYKDVMNMPL
ncbi:MAG: flagellar hook-basal body complex protein FliE [Oceanicoccus sp.]|jgi:flagellar hook-basal body complex protein FliE